MDWLKTVVLDLVVVVIAAIFVFTDQEWARWVILIYTPFMLLLKVVAALSASKVKPLTGSKKAKVVAPDWFFHAIYAGTVGLFVYDRWWLMAVGWLAIWIASFVFMVKSRPSEARAKR